MERHHTYVWSRFTGKTKFLSGDDIDAVDFNTSVKEAYFSLDNKALWLKYTDTDWHSPLAIVFRAIATKNKKAFYKSEGYSVGRGRSSGSQSWNQSSSWWEEPSWSQPAEWGRGSSHTPARSRSSKAALTEEEERAPIPRRRWNRATTPDSPHSSSASEQAIANPWQDL